jgi:voltage-gated potassium channel Kch
MSKIRWTQRLQYKFHNTFAKGTIALIGWLALASAGMILVASVVVKLSGALPEDTEDLSIPRIAWMSLMRTLDAGTMGGDQGDTFFLAMMLAVTFGGIFVVSTLIGVLTSGIEGQIDEIRKGRSLVCEEDHTVVLGWSPQVFSIVRELCAANESMGGAAIAILGDKDKVEMEDELRDKIEDLRGSWVVCRTGNPIDPDDVGIVNPNDSRSVIVLAPEDAHNPDSHVIKTILALTNNPGRRNEPYHIVAEIRDPKNLEPARLVGGDEATYIAVEELISRITVQTCRQSGLSVVYTELLDFDGDEIYLEEIPELVGKTFADSLFAFQTCAVLGVARADGVTQVMPPQDQVIEKGDRLILVAEDDSKVSVGGPGRDAVDEESIVDRQPAPPEPEQTLILGWNRRGPSIVRELESYVAPGSEVVIVADVDDVAASIAEGSGKLEKLILTTRKGDTTDRRTLDSLDIGRFEHVITLSYSETLDVQEADARTLITLLHVRDIVSRLDAKVSIVSEMLDVKNRQLAEVTRADDFIVSDRLVSLMLSQLSEEKALQPVFQDLFDPAGAEIYLKSAADYVTIGDQINFYTVLESARRKGEVAIGYRIAALSQDAEKMYGVRVNPDKVARVAFRKADKIIVLAES